jgi:hypothetical protein
MKYYKVTNSKDGSTPWIIEGDQGMIHFRDNILAELPYFIIEQITKEQFDKEAAERPQNDHAI